MQQEMIMIPSLKRQEEYCNTIKGRQRELYFTKRQYVQGCEVSMSDQDSPPLRDAPSVVWGISMKGRNLLIDDMDPTEEFHMRMPSLHNCKATTNQQPLLQHSHKMQQEMLMIPSLKRQEEYCKAMEGRQSELCFTKRQSVQEYEVSMSDQDSPSTLRDSPSVVWGIPLIGEIW
jgi:hypothetical protein